MFGRWGIRGLLGSWAAYWAALAAIALGPAITAIWAATHTPSGKGSVTVSASGAVLSLIVTLAARTTYSASIHLLTLAFWVAVPPLLLWAAWLVTRRRAAPARPDVSGAPDLEDRGATRPALAERAPAEWMGGSGEARHVTPVRPTTGPTSAPPRRDR